MNPEQIISELQRHKEVFRALLLHLPAAHVRWKPNPSQWSLLEVVCHLHDEEREDFRARVDHCLHRPEAAMTPIDPVGWVQTRDYASQNYEVVLKAFLAEREESLAWLHSLEAPAWGNVHHHPKLGAMSAGMVLANWLAHDYLHIRQILRIKHQLLAQSGHDLSYAGEW
jgi:hypothetical protein